MLNGELFLNLTELKYVVERWRMDYQTPVVYAEQCRTMGRTHPDKQAEEMKSMVETLS